mgnify:CR=1 FL=1
MIIDSLNNCALYAAVHPRLRKAFDLLAATDFSKLEAGRHLLDGEDIFVKRKEEEPLEGHNAYIDIQVSLEGACETFGWSERRDCRRPRGTFDPAKDILFYDDSPQTYFTLRRGQFVLFFPEDAHAPMVGEGMIRKAIVKVRI